MKILLVLFCTIVILFTNPPFTLAIELETGGTNYEVYDLGEYGNNSTAENFAKLDTNGGVKSVIGAYDLNPQAVKNQLNAMCQSGQRKIAFMLHHGRFSPYPESTPLYNLIPDQTYPQNSSILIINSTGGKLQPRHAQNLFNIIDYIAKQKCFNEIQFRFAPSWYSFFGSWGDPTDWDNPLTGWNEGVYKENYEFVKFVRNIIQTTLIDNQSTIKVFYDLGAETGGATYEYLVPDSDPYKQKKVLYFNAMIEMYQKRLLADYAREYGTDDTYGFSIALIPNRFTRLIAVYDKVGIRPRQHAVDIYDLPNTGMKSQLDSLYTEIQTTGEANKPIIIQETYFTDSRAFNEIMEVKNRLGLNIRTIMQWQMERAKTYRPGTTELAHFSTINTQYIYKGQEVLPGDLNSDGHVNTTDYALMLSSFGTKYTIFDYNILVTNYGK